jgi:hypothetical protein
MCCFSGRVERVSGTKIFARADGARQLVVYAMSLTARGELAMVLPIPVAQPAREDAVQFVDFTESPVFFAQLDLLFEPQYLSLEPQSRQKSRGLAVHQVGAFEASFVPRAADFDRLDPRFSIRSELWARVPSVAGFGFVVFKLRDPAPSGILASVLGAKPAPRHFHPMAFWFERQGRERLFFPTLHVHDGDVHATAAFDHRLYAQTGTPPGRLWDESDGSLQKTYGFAKTMLADAPGYRIEVKGTRPNIDTWIAG